MFHDLCQRALVTMAVVSSGLASAATQGASDEVLYVFTLGGNWLIAYDPETLTRGPLNVCSFKLRGQAALMGLAFGNDRLYSFDMNWESLPDRFVEIHPANGDPLFVGYPGQSQTNNWALDFNPVSGRLYAVESYVNLFEVDPATGTVTHIAKLFGPPGVGGCDCFSMAINSAGIAVITSAPAGISGGPSIGYLDLTTGAVTPIGRVGAGIGNFWDLAFDSQDRLWGVFRDYFDPTRDGLYRINLSPLGFEKVHDDPELGISWQSIAFGPVPKVRGYCVPTSSVLGCTPSISSVGLCTSAVPSGLEVRAEDAPSGALGFLVWGGGAQANLPIGGGTLCIGGPLARSYLIEAGGTVPPGTDCSGIWAVDLNALLYRQGIFQAGDVVRCQWLGRDSATASVGAAVMSDALELVLVP